MSAMKRKEAPSKASSTAKKTKLEIPDYHLTPTVKEEDGSVQWPAPRAQMETARDIILNCSKANSKTLIVPDKDADGLSAGAILRHTLILLGLSSDLIDVHLVSKGNTIHAEEERKAMASYGAQFIFVLDQGSRAGPPVTDGALVSLIIDHHRATSADFPLNSLHVTACNSPPVATSSLLTYTLCSPLHPEVSTLCAWLCIVGTHADLGNTIKWLPPFPDMQATLKTHTKKTLNEIVSLINAPRRTPERDVHSAWQALHTTTDPRTILNNPRLLAARREVSSEVERCTHTAPKFSPDGKIALFRIHSLAQVHPVIATRWAGHLQSKNLEMVMVANEGYLPGCVNFSCRIPRCARGREAGVDIIEMLKGFAMMSSSSGGGEVEGSEVDKKAPLIERLGDDFARGHPEASGGIVAVAEFEELMENMQIGVKPPPKTDSPAKKKKTAIDSGQKNNLMSYFTKTTTTASTQQS